jgi:hypothetical protein
VDVAEAPEAEHRAVPRARWPYFGRAQRRLLGCALAIWLASALPWVVIPPIGFWGRASALSVAWMLWGGLMTLAAAIAPFRVVAVVSALTGGATAVYLAGWQALRLMRLCDGGDIAALRCFPGPGLFIALAAGVLAMWQGRRAATGG